MAKQEHIFAVARVKAMENELLDKHEIDSLVTAKDLKAAVRILIEKGFLENEGDTTDFVEKQNEKLWSFIGELTQDKDAFKTLKVKNDFHNAKVAIKSEYIKEQDESLYEKDSIIPVDELVNAIKNKDFADLPKFISEYACQAYELIFKTGDPQLCDSILDKGLLNAMSEFAKQSGNDVLTDYAKTQSTIADIKVAIRGARSGKDQKFFENALSGISEFNAASLAQVASQGQEALFSFLESSNYAEAVEMLKNDFSLFETWCDNVIIERIQRQKYVFTTLSPIVAYILARQNEIKTVNIILASKKNGVEEQEIRKMVMQTYV